MDGIPEALCALLSEFAACDPDVAYWAAMPDAEEPAGTGDCVALSARFVAACRAAGLSAVVAELHPAGDADPLQGWHRFALVAADGEHFGVDWTARQLHDLGAGSDPDAISCPLVFRMGALPYRSLCDARFTAVLRLDPADPPD